MNDEMLAWIMDLLFIMVFSLMGAIVKDVYNTLTNKDSSVKILRIIISTLISSIILFSLSDIILEKISLKLFILPCFIGGMTGFELMSKIRNIDFWLKLYSNPNKENLINTLKEDKKDDNE